MANKKTSDYDALPGGSITSTWQYDIANPTIKNYKGTHAEVSQNVADEPITGLDTTASSLKGAINENFDRAEVVNGHILETINLVVTSNGSVITASLNAATGNNLTFAFSNGLIPVDVTTPKTVSLTAGSATVPQENWLYVLQSDPTTLVVSTSDYPNDSTTEYAPIGRIVVQDAITVQSTGVIKQHNSTDHVTSDGGLGHLHDINEWIREQWATYISGVAQTITGSGTANLTYAVTSGVIRQLHTQLFPAFVNPANLYVINDSVSPYKNITDFGSGVLLDSAGGALTNKYYNLVIWGIASQTGMGQSKLILNLCGGSYANQTQAEEDLSKFTNFSIPSEYKGVGFLVQRILIKNLADSTFTVIETENLRGQTPNNIAGSSVAVGTEFPDSIFRVFNNADNTKEIAFSAANITTGTTRTTTAANRDLDLANPIFDSVDMAGDIDMNANKNIYGVGTDVVQTIRQYNNASTAKPVLKFSPTIGGLSNYHGEHLEVTETGKAAGNHLESHDAGANDIVSTRNVLFTLNRYIGYLSTGNLQSGTRTYWGEEYDGSTKNLTYKTINDSTVTNRFRIGWNGVLSALTTNYASLITLPEHLVNKEYADDLVAQTDTFRNINGRNIASVFNGLEKFGANRYVEKVSATIFDADDGTYISALSLLNGHALIAFDDDGNSNAGTMITVDVNGVTIETATVFTANATTYIDTTLLLNGNFAVSYIDADDGNKVKFVIYDEDLVQIVAPYTVYAGQAMNTSVTTLQDGNFALAYTDNDDGNHAKFFIFSEAGVEVKGETTFSATSTNYPNIATLTDGHIVFAYATGAGGKYLILSEDGTSTIVSESTFESDNSKYIKVVALTNGTFLIAYQDDVDNDKGKCVIISAIGGELLAPFAYATTNMLENTPVVLLNGNVLITYKDNGTPKLLEYVILDVTGKIIQGRTIVEDNVNIGSPNAPVALINGNVLIPYADTANRFVIHEPSAVPLKGVTIVTTATYDVVSTDELLFIDRTATGTCAVTIPAAQALPGRPLSVIDSGDNSSTFNITISAAGGGQIKGNATLVIAGDGDGVSLVCKDPAEWWTD